jgi:hypothetical protein
MPAILAALVFASVAPPALSPAPPNRAEPRAATAFSVPDVPAIDPSSFQDAMRKLWEDHVTWTRLYIVSAIAGLPDVEPTAQRLLRNQADIGAAIKPFYGDAAGDRLTALLRSHILIAADLVTAAKAGNATGTQTASARWDANAVEIADFLSAANPTHWPRETMRAEMRHHLALTLREAQARLKSDWTGDIAAYDEVHTHILGLADVLAAGIIKQFPKQFSR